MELEFALQRELGLGLDYSWASAPRTSLSLCTLEGFPRLSTRGTFLILHQSSCSVKEARP